MHIDIEYIVAAAAAGGLYLGWRMIRRKAVALRAEIDSATPGRKPTDADVLAQIRAGKNLVAAKLYMDVHGASMRDAVEAVEVLALQQNGKAGPQVRTTSVHVAGDPAFMAQLMALIQNDKMISAIKLYRDHHDCDLKTAKEAVEALAENRQALAAVPPVAGLGEIMQLVHADRKIEAIKRYREQFDCDLKTAKDAIDAMAASRMTQTMVIASGHTEEFLTTQIDVLKASGQDPAILAILEELLRKLQSTGTR